MIVVSLGDFENEFFEVVKSIRSWEEQLGCNSRMASEYIAGVLFGPSPFKQTFVMPGQQNHVAIATK